MAVCSAVNGEGEYPVVHNFDAKSDTLNKFLLKGKKFSVVPLMKTSSLLIIQISTARSRQL